MEIRRRGKSGRDACCLSRNRLSSQRGQGKTLPRFLAQWRNTQPERSNSRCSVLAATPMVGREINPSTPRWLLSFRPASGTVGGVMSPANSM